LKPCTENFGKTDADGYKVIIDSLLKVVIALFNGTIADTVRLSV